VDSRFEPIPDPIDEEVARLLAHPVVRARLEAFEERRARGELGPGIPHEEVRRRLGLDRDAGTQEE
jgi:hypothetical protein